jgi:energy-coupling factor transport system permease protein
MMRLVGFVAVAAQLCLVLGWRGLVRTAWVYLLFTVVIAAFNMFFGGLGMSVWFYFFGHAVTLEGFVYGLASGLMLATVLAAFSAYQKTMSEQGFLALFSHIAPTIALMVAKIMAFVPQLVHQACVMSDARKVLVGPSVVQGTPPKKGKRKTGVAQAVRLSSQLLEWGMESSIITANSMSARGFGARERTTYHSMRFTLRDGQLLVVIGVFLGLSIAATVVAQLGFSFYPYMSSLAAWWVYLPYALFGLLPVLVEGGERLWS